MKRQNNYTRRKRSAYKNKILSGGNPLLIGASALGIIGLLGLGAGAYKTIKSKPTSSTKARKTLGVSRNATLRQITKSYRKLALTTHPDKPGGDEEKFKAISNAYQKLKTSHRQPQSSTQRKSCMPFWKKSSNRRRSSTRRRSSSGS
tara:strand:+ start:999 stop:1439 length:441 start_codon:yes stop_codon:yes gene_type:complete